MNIHLFRIDLYPRYLQYSFTRFKYTYNWNFSIVGIATDLKGIHSDECRHSLGIL